MKTLALAMPALLALGCGVSDGLARAPDPGQASEQRLGGPAVGVVNATTKIRPGYSGALAAAASLDAARNEFEPFQIAVIAGTTAITQVRATATALSGPQGTIAASNLRLYQVALYNVLYASNVEGASGEWPDPLIPAVDAYDGQTRNAFPFDVAANKARAIWVDVFVPPGTAPGTYAGSVTVTGTGISATTIPVSLRVRAFTLPSTATLKSAFGFSVDAACRAHNGTTFCNTNADADAWNRKYVRAALDHRVSVYSPYYVMPHDNDWAYFDGLAGLALDGTAATKLAGAKLTSFRNESRDATFMSQEKAHFDAKGWTNRLFDYTCDEPPMTCAWSDIPGRASAAHAAGLRTLVTTDIDDATAHLPSWQNDLDIVCPVVNFMDGTFGNRRARYDTFLSRGPQKELWWYQSCMSHGCGGCGAGNATQGNAGYPSYVIDSSAMQNRAMEWLSYEYDVSGELYYETVQYLDRGWSSYTNPTGAYCDFGGNGDGSLFYPGTPQRIGGTSGVPVESVRLKMIREGMEDYEYLHLLDSLGDRATAKAEARALFPSSWQVTAAGATPAALYATRARLADRIEVLMGAPPPPRPQLKALRTFVAPVLNGTLAEFAAAPALTVSSATFRLLWDPTNLYVSAKVTDAEVLANGTGRDGALWNADAVEVMLDGRRERTTPPGINVRHVIASALGDLYDAAGAGGTGNAAYDLAGLQLAAARVPGGWQLALSIPWSQIPLNAGEAVAPGLVIGADLALDDLDASGLAVADWANINPFAQGDRWNEIVLQDAPPPAISWWNAAWTSRVRLTVTNRAATPLVTGFQAGVPFTSPGPDLRALRWSGAAWSELTRSIDEDGTVWFRLQAPVAPSAADDSYYLYFGNPSAPSAPANPAAVFDFWDSMAGFSLGPWLKSGTVTFTGQEWALSDASELRSDPLYGVNTALDFLVRDAPLTDRGLNPLDPFRFRFTSTVAPPASRPPVRAAPVRLGVERFADRVTWRLGDSTVTLPLPAASTAPLELAFENAGAGTIYLSRVRVRKAVSPSPSVAVGPVEHP